MVIKGPYVKVAAVEKMLLKKKNRIKKLEPKTGKFWCGFCDGAKIGNFEICPRCGKRNGDRIIKKSSI
jgi:hypothetical protein